MNIWTYIFLSLGIAGITTHFVFGIKDFMDMLRRPK
jgi:hypothetical protein